MLDEVANCYSRPGSAKPLVLDKYDGPTTFDVVDTSYLVDSIGFHNLIPYVIPLFASNISILYTNISIDGKNEKHILSSMLCTPNVSLICTFYGIAPTAYVAGLITRAHQQDNLNYSTAKDSSFVHLFILPSRIGTIYASLVMHVYFPSLFLSPY
jgi:hypothetical protein